MRGVPDFGSLVQFNPYETGYAAFIICQMPKFIELLARRNSDYNKLIKNWAHIIEYEFIFIIVISIGYFISDFLSACHC